MILVFADLRCDRCDRGLTYHLGDEADATPEGIAAAQRLAMLFTRLCAIAKGWAVGDDDVTCGRCVERPDVDTVYQDSGPDWGRR